MYCVFKQNYHNPILLIHSIYELKNCDFMTFTGLNDKMTLNMTTLFSGIVNIKA